MLELLRLQLGQQDLTDYSTKLEIVFRYGAESKFVNLID